jgi:hypothetical protein
MAATPDPTAAETETDGPALADPDDRTVRALTEDLHVAPARVHNDHELDGPTTSHVVYSGEDRYEVDLLAGMCDCPDALHRGVRCKHIRVTEFWVEGHREVPAWVETDALGDFLAHRLADD